MGHSIAAFIARKEVLGRADCPSDQHPRIPLSQGFAMILASDELVPDSPAAAPVEGDGLELFWALTPALAEWGRRLSARAAVAYIETDYWGGGGTQAAMMWEQGTVALPPARARMGPINAVLNRLGVRQGDARDRFEALGLERFRSHDDWLDAARSP